MWNPLEEEEEEEEWRRQQRAELKLDKVIPQHKIRVWGQTGKMILSGERTSEIEWIPDYNPVHPAVNQSFD